MNIFNRFFALTILAILTVTLASCGSSVSDSGGSSGSGGGFASKGPFVSGATVTAYVLATDGSRQSASPTATTNTTGNRGEFTFANLSGVNELVIFGKYLDENTGIESTRTAEITAVVDVRGAFSNNINIATDIESRRTRAHMANGMHFTAAKELATAEVAPLFGFPADVDLGALNLVEIRGDDIENPNRPYNLILLKASAIIAASPTILVDLRAGAANNAIDEAMSAKGLNALNAQIANLDTLKITTIVSTIINSFTATATAGVTETASVTIPKIVAELENANQAPVISAIADIGNVDEDAGDLSGLFTVGDDSTPLSLTTPARTPYPTGVTLEISSTNPKLIDTVTAAPHNAL
ncbi:MAG: hypothetical protein HAW58_06215 [Candidatus Thioglobus sp.]|nr:hypothetical protein [Candidatus Thioglobus sp.]